ncbi:BL10 [Sebaldella termitidis]|jgi:large subunit ribosomal protein L6|uniref:Large ribosomal subunit protein uL6 n=1 Tax=Sebaldella termitidis (strain ATCC 33386 / NCTC 11300) TaxID=526218 RepID=D1AGU2_SEBTE|nr:50S ribosomal protein L6 [Sebaldella termitidis]ACZ10812.1 ribosomal protein L6 [Sebaldella termitidis ATCC 33386]SUI26155.1 BL10 [Sebaldella termitidis]
MSRVGRKVITIPSGVELKQEGNKITVKGPKGQLEREFSPEITVKVENGEINVTRPNDLPDIRALHGTTRAVLNNMIVGVNQGFEKKLELVGVGYRVQAAGKGLTLSLGFSHPVEIEPVEGITFKVEGNTKISVEGINKELVGQIAANIRAKRPPEPYKGKGVKYADEQIRRKEGKKG